ncbi:hypothetical protein P1312_088 [Thermobifida phage P1312]|nr:hypothetical protein P1312_088 [Thermobifida phage P1312]
MGFADLLFCGFGGQGFAVTPSVVGVGVGNGLVKRVGRPFLEGFLEGFQKPFGKGFGKGSSNPFDESAGALSALSRQLVDGEPRQLITEHSAQGGRHGGLDVAERRLEYVRLLPQPVVADESTHENFFGVLVYDHVPVRVEAFQGGGDPGAGHAVGEARPAALLEGEDARGVDVGLGEQDEVQPLGVDVQFVFETLVLPDGAS